MEAHIFVIYGVHLLFAVRIQICRCCFFACNIVWLPNPPLSFSLSLAAFRVRRKWKQEKGREGKGLRNLTKNKGREILRIFFLFSHTSGVGRVLYTSFVSIQIGSQEKRKKQNIITFISKIAEDYNPTNATVWYICFFTNTIGFDQDIPNASENSPEGCKQA